MHLAGATVIRGFLGFGKSSHLHAAKILRLSMDLPMVVEIVDVPEKVNAFLPYLEPDDERRPCHAGACARYSTHAGDCAKTHLALSEATSPYRRQLPTRPVLPPLRGVGR
jgi:hypothetical protein